MRVISATIFTINLKNNSPGSDEPGLLRLSKNYEKTSATEQQGVCAGDKKSPARSIKQVFQTFRESLKNRTAGQKHFFDTLNSPGSDEPGLLDSSLF